MNRAEILAEAKKCVCGQREQDYGTPEDNFTTAGYAACAGEIATQTNETPTIQNEDTCVMCSASIPEGSQYCNECARQLSDGGRYA